MLRITIWNEGLHELQNETVRGHYPDRIDGCLANALARRLPQPHSIRRCGLDDPEHGLSQDVLADTDVLLWWGHLAHDRVDDRVVQAAKEHVLDGMGLIALHSAHASKLFQSLMGTGCMLRWRDSGERERMSVIDPGHPIMAGLDHQRMTLDISEMYGEPFDIPPPDELLAISWFAGGEVFRSCCTFRRGYGRIVYFSPGHELYPIYHVPWVQQVISNACLWARPSWPDRRSRGAVHVPQPTEPVIL
jgi:trehalose utilization protein